MPFAELRNLYQTQAIQWNQTTIWGNKDDKKCNLKLREWSITKTNKYNILKQPENNIK